MKISTKRIKDNRTGCESPVFYAALAILAITVWALLAFRSPAFLVKIEGRSLFLASGQFFLDSMSLAGGLLSYVGLFLTQFLFHPVVGAAILVILWVTAAVAAKRTFGLKGADALPALIPVAALIAAGMETGYLVYSMKCPGWFFTPTLGYLAAIMPVWLYRRLESVPGMSVFAVLSVVAGYPLIGAYSLLAAAMFAATSLARNRRQIVPALTATISAAVVPLLWSRLFTTGFTSRAYVANLPLWPFNGGYALKWIPYLLLLLSSVRLAAMRGTSPADGKFLPLKRCPDLLLAMLVPYLFWYSDANFRAELEMDSALSEQDWKEILRIHSETDAAHSAGDARAYAARSARLESLSGARREAVVEDFADRFYEPSRYMVLYKNLALTKLGISGNEAFRYRDGGRMPVSPSVNALTIQCGKQLYFHYGLFHYCHRWCIEDATEYGWTVESLQYALKAAIMSGNRNLAHKFIDILSKTAFHRKWAESQRRYADNPKALAESGEYSSLLPIASSSQYVGNDNSLLEPFLMKYFTVYGNAVTSEQFDDIAMLWAMQTQDIGIFWNCFDRWLTSHPGKAVPRYYQEAAYLYGNLSNDVDISHFPFDRKVIEKYRSFMQFVEKHPVYNPKEMDYIYRQQFGDTFYYFYYFIRNIKSY